MKNLLSLIIFITLITCSNSFANEKAINFVGAEFPPYSGEELDDMGMIPSLIKEALEPERYKVIYELRPFARALHEVKEGRKHAVAPIYKTNEREAEFAFSESIGESRTVFIKLKNKNISYNKLEDLKPYRIGLVLKTSVNQEFDSADFLKKDTVTSYIQNIKKLLAGRVDLVAGNEYVILYNLEKFFTEKEYRQIQIMEPALQIQSDYAAFSKQIPNYSEVLNDFNKGIRRMISDGTYEKIMNKYKISLSRENIR